MNLSGVETLLMPVFMFLLMLGMGATLSMDNFRQILQRPTPALIGLASQYGWMPLIALVLALTLDLSPPSAVGLIIMGCAAGGPISNFFTYIARGDVALSISMTVISTLSGLLLIPLLLFIYTAPFLDAATGNNLAIPHGKIVAILLAILVPVGLGMALRKRSRRWARRMERSGSVAGFIVIIMIIASILLRQSDTLLQIEPGIYVAGALLGPIGFILGYLSARIMGLEAAQRSAVSLETGSQNAPLVLGIIVISFPPQIQSEILVAPILYGVAIVPFTALAACLFRRGR